ncbi:MAG: hypothetical protein JNK18_16380 [Cyclobacteriaceae bacterium]|nr:hypothetical protein [Cyclobacteriaceae bacterium]
MRSLRSASGPGYSLQVLAYAAGFPLLSLTRKVYVLSTAIRSARHFEGAAVTNNSHRKNID